MYYYLLEVSKEVNKPNDMFGEPEVMGIIGRYATKEEAQQALRTKVREFFGWQDIADEVTDSELGINDDCDYFDAECSEGDTWTKFFDYFTIRILEYDE